MFPYGNARTSGTGPWSFSCQHGKNECIGNMYQACAMEHNNGTSAAGVPNWWPFVYCMENSRDPVSSASKCASDNNVDWSAITTCAGSDPASGSADDGNALMHSIGEATNNLQPPHQWTPWVVLNGKPLSSAELDLPLYKLICKAYQGTLPSGCSKMAEKLDFREE